MASEPRCRLAKTFRWMLACGALAVAGTPWAAGTHRITVGAIVVAAGNCQFNSGSVDIAYRCTGGGAAPTIGWTVTSSDTLFAAARLRNVVMPQSGTAHKNVDHRMTVAEIVSAMGFQGALAPGSDTDAVVLTIAP
jgi:hypothetical protein